MFIHSVSNLAITKIFSANRLLSSPIGITTHRNNRNGWAIVLKTKGKTIYNAGISLFVNVVYYGVVYIGFKNGLFETNMMFIIMMFGFGMVVHMLLSVALYFFERKRSADTAVLQ